MGDENRIEETEALIRRLDVLERLCRSPAYVRDLVDETGQSRSTINRAVNELEGLRLVERGEAGIRATTTGRLARARLTGFLSSFDDVLAAEPVLEAVPPDADLDPAVVVGCETIPATDPAPYRPLERLHDDLAGAEAYRALVPTLEDPRHVRLLFEHVVTEGKSAELVVTPEVFRTLRQEFPRRMAAMAREEAFSAFVGPVPPFGLDILERGSGRDAAPLARVTVLNDRNRVHGLLVNDSEAAVRWATDRYEAARREATDRTDALTPDPDGGVALPDVGIATAEGSLPVSLEREGFVGVDASYFREEPVADPPTAWRAGLSLAEVHTGYAIPRPALGGDARDDGARDDPGDDDPGDDGLAAALEADLAAGSDRVVVGPPGTGKSTVCKRVACRWYDAGRGPVLYRESDRGRAFASVADLVATVAAADGHALVVVEDAVRPDAVAAFEAIDRLSGREDVSFLLDAREHEWRERSNPSIEATALEAVPLPPVSEADCERLVAHFERTTGRSVDVSAARLWSAVRDESAADDASNAMVRLIHRLSTYADPLADGPTALEEAVAAVHDALADDEVALSVCVLANALNAASVGVDRGLLYAVADPDDFGAVDAALDRLEGRVLFPRDDGRYRTVHEEWSAAFLARLVDARGEAAAADRFGTVVGEALALADDPERRDRIAAHLGDRWTLPAVADEPRRWADETARALDATGRERSALAPLLGDGERDSVALPEACSDALADERPVALGRAFLAGGYYDRAERAFERLPRDDPELGAERLLGLARASLGRGEYDDAIERCRACLSLVDDGAPIRARTRVRLGDALAERGAYDDAESHYRAALEAFREEGRDRWTARTLQRVGVIAHERGEYDRARERFESSLDRRRDLGDRRGEADVLHSLGRVARRLGEFDLAERYYERSLDRRRDLGDRHGEARTLGNLGNVAASRGEFDRAERYYERSRELNADLGDRHGVARALNSLAYVPWALGEYERARSLYEQSRDRFADLGDRHGEAKAIYNLGCIASDRYRHERALSLYERSLDVRRDLGDRHGVARTLDALGGTAVRLGEYERAREAYDRSLERYESLGDADGRARCLGGLGRVAARRGEYDRARTLFERRLELAGTTTVRAASARTLVRLGRVALYRGEYDRARERFERARDVATEDDAADDLARSEAGLADVAIAEGAPGRAADRLESAREAVGDGTGESEPDVRLARARLALDRGDVDAADDHARRALEGFESIGDAHRSARSVRLRGRIAAAADEDDAAREHLLDALETFAEIGAFEDALATLEALVDARPGDDAVERWYDRARNLSGRAPGEVRERHRAWIEAGPAGARD